MNIEQLIRLGYEVGTGEPVDTPEGHSVFVGQSQLSGKTTAMKALLKRGKNLTALTFVTKRGEIDFSDAHLMDPFFSERVDWEFVRAILESTFREKMKYETTSIWRATQNAKTLADVRTNLERLQANTKSAFNQDMYLRLQLYLDKILPHLNTLPKTKKLVLRKGLNVMDLAALPDELQMLIIESCLRYIHEHLENVICVIPEAWKMIPDQKNTPVKNTFTNLIREGGVLKNFIWADTQDTAGMDKLMLRQARVWLIGVQRDPRELKRNLDAIPLPKKQKPKPEEVMALPIGHFFVCLDSGRMFKTYVQPAWMSDADARAIARGEKTINDVTQFTVSGIKDATPATLEALHTLGEHVAYQFGAAAPTKEPTSMETLQDLITERDTLAQRLDDLNQQIEQLKGQGLIYGNGKTKTASSENPTGAFDFDTIYEFVRKRALQDPKLLQVLTTIPRIEVQEQIEPLTVDGNTLRGKIALLVKEGLIDEQPKGSKEFRDVLVKRGWNPKEAYANISNALEDMAKKGFVTREEGNTYLAVTDMKANIVKTR